MKADFHADAMPTVKYLIWLVLVIFLQFSIEEKILNFLPGSYIGTDAVKQIHDYLILWFFGRILIFFLPVIMSIITYLIVCLKRRKKLDSDSIKLVLMGSVIFSMLLGLCGISYREYNHFELQMEQNQYFGTKLMKTAQFILDIDKDLNSDDTETISGELSSFYEYYINSKRKVVFEYALQNTEDKAYIGQISEYDRKQISESWYEINLYPHSGLIASIDEIPDR